MKDERGVINCDCCGRQILTRKCDEKDIVGPRSEAHNIGINKHCCGKCWPDYQTWEQIERAKSGL